jgi:hypothetical protein
VQAVRAVLRAAARHGMLLIIGPAPSNPPLPPAAPLHAGLLQALPGLGPRALRYSLLLEDGKVVVLNVDKPGPKASR